MPDLSDEQLAEKWRRTVIEGQGQLLPDDSEEDEEVEADVRHD